MQDQPSFSLDDMRAYLSRTLSSINNNKHQQERKEPMAIKLIANYSKRLGLPGYSSHQFSELLGH